MSTITLLLAQSPSPAPVAPTLLGMLVPWLFLDIMMGSILASMARRKAKNPVLWFFLGFIPLVGFYLAFILASRPDAAWLDRISRLEEQLGSGSEVSTRVEGPPI